MPRVLDDKPKYEGEFRKKLFLLVAMRLMESKKNLVLRVGDKLNVATLCN